MKKVNQFPLVGFFFWINSQKWEQKFQPIPNVGKLNSINSQKQNFQPIPSGGKLNSINSQSYLNVKEKDWFKYFNQFLPVGIPVGINSHFGNKLKNQFPIGNKYFNQFLPVAIPVGINSHFGNKLDNQIPHLRTNISINLYKWEFLWESIRTLGIS